MKDGASGLAVAYGICTSQAVDCEGERCIYADSKPEYVKWSQDAMKSTLSAGQEVSFGNIRVMHTAEIGGKAIGIDFKDDAQQVWLMAEAKDAAISDQLRRGIFRSFSHSGKYAYRRCEECTGDIPGNDNFCPKCSKAVIVQYAVKDVSEVSLCDKGANPEANFTYVKADNSIELRKFATPAVDQELVKSIRTLPAITEAQCEAAARGEDPKLTEAQTTALLALKAAMTKRVAGEDLPSSAFAYVGNPTETATWKFPIHFSTKDKSASHVRNALARFGQAKGIPESEKAAVLGKIKAAAKKYGVEVSDESEKIAKALEAAINKAADAHGLKKGLYDLSQFADLISSLNYLWMDATWESEYEGDGSEMPNQLQMLIETAAQCFLDMAQEEIAELTALHKAELATKSAASAAPAAPAANEEKMNEEMLKVLKAARSGMHGFCKGMAKVAKASASAHAELAPSETLMAESHKARAAYYNDLHKSFTEAAAVEGITPELKAEHEAQAAAYKAEADHHTAAEAHHVLKAKHHASMSTVHTSAGTAYTTMAAFQEEGDTAKSAETELAKMAAPEVAAVPNVADIIQQALAAANESHKTVLADMQKSFTAQTEALTSKLASITDQVEKKNAVPGKLRLVPMPGTTVAKAAGAEAAEPLESGAVGF